MPNMLPKLTNSAIKNPIASKWSKDGINFIDDLAKSMEINGDFAKSGKISSIPDVWAKPLLFEIAMFESADSQERQFAKGLHERVIGEWRSIMAMLALKDIRHLELTAKEVRLQPENSAMDNVLYRMRPTKSIDNGQTDWDVLYVIYLNGLPIAMTSPTTLVCAAADYERNFFGSIPQPWSNDGNILSDPISLLTGEDKAYVYAWLEELSKNILQIREKNDITTSLMSCINAYKIDLRAGMSNVGYEAVESGLGLYTGVFGFMNMTAKAKPGSAADSDVRILPSNDRQPETALLMADPATLSDMARVWNMDKNQICVWSGISANDVSESKLDDDNRTAIGNAILKDAKYIRPSDIFTDKVFIITLTNEDYTLFAFTYNIASGDAGLSRDHREIIPPIRKEMLEYFGVEYLKNNLSVEYSPSALTVKLNVNFNNGRRYTITKTYDLKDNKKGEFINSVIDIPCVEIWPNVRIHNWHKYYLCYVNNTFERRDLAEDMPFFEPWTFSNREKNVGVPNGGLANIYTAQLYDFPEAFICSVVRSDGNPQEIGLLLVDKPEEIDSVSVRDWNIGIDFGTSSTMVYYTEGKNQPKPLLFNSRLQSITRSNEMMRAFHMATQFIPVEYKDVTGSFQTIFQSIHAIDSMNDIKPMLDGRVFPLTVERAKDFSDMYSSMFPNLKWDTDPLNRSMAASFIEQVCLQCAVEAAVSGAKSITWNFSYPSAFSNTDKRSYENSTEWAVERALKGTKYEDNIKINDLCMESIATASFFNKLNAADANFVNGAICLDIGAGTTDISIISGMPGRIVYHTSVQYAGRTLFAPVYKWLEERLNNGGAIGSTDISMVSVDHSQDDYKKIILDAVMREYGDDILSKELPTIYDDESGNNGKINEMLSYTQLAMTGLFYYVGTILRELHNRGLYVEDNVPDIYVGGNGSRVLKWIIGGGRRFKANDDHLEVLKRAMVEAADISSSMNFSINLSEQPKIEVAAGMLTEKPHNELFNEEDMLINLHGVPENSMDVDPVIAASVISGEEYMSYGQSNTAYSFMSANNIAQGITVDELPKLDELIGSYNARPKNIWGNTITIDDSIMGEVLKRVNGYYVNEMSKNISDIRVEPIFLIAMKKLVERIVNELEEEQDDE